MEIKLQDFDKLKAPDDFTFPFPPYGIQLDFMKNLYNTIEDEKIGIFESPTGTGKSLSIICGALTWLRDHEEREIRNLEVSLKKIESNREQSDDWLTAQIKQRENNAILQQLRQQLDRIHLRNDNIKKIKEHVKEKSSKKWKALNIATNLSNEKENEENDNKKTGESDDLLEEFLEHSEDSDTNLEEPEQEEEEQPITRIIYCSRTHSQLSQFISEIQKTKFSDDARIVHLASRQNYCINKKFQNITNVAIINEKCLEMQHGKEYSTTLKDEQDISVKRQKTGSITKCLHMKGINEFSEMILSQVMDVEAVSQGGRKTGSCPYYATRTSTPLSQVIVIPYHTLLHKGSREASGLCLDNSIIIIDEAHNLLETISHIHSSQITGQQLIVTHSQLCQYRDRYAAKFSAINLLYLNQLIFVISALMKLIRNRNDDTESNVQLLKVADFIMAAEIDNYNLYKLLAFCKQSKIAHKLQRFSDKSGSFVKIDNTVKNNSATGIKEFIQGIKNKKRTLKKTTPIQSQVIGEQSNNGIDSEEQISQPLFQVTAFLSCLTQEYKDGRVVVSREITVGKSAIKYLLLEPASVVTDIVNKARSVILAGGTMEPVSEFKERLFNVCGIPSNRIIHFSCGHVIPKENILPIIVCISPTGKQLDFSYNSRSSAVMLNEIGRLLINICNVVPSGMVCFFPSYEYENYVYEYLEKNGMIKNISLKKKVFREPKKSSEVEKVLTDYSLHIENSKKNGRTNGALLFSVVGGKLSEGLNFSDDLGRCVIVIGMPYPNMKSPELQEKMKYLEEHCGSNAGKIHYENLCMKAVNQSVGRSIRHRNDYSSVLLVDQRYSRPNIYKLLPKWMQESLKIEREKFGPVLGQLSKFFKLHTATSQ